MKTRYKRKKNICTELSLNEKNTNAWINMDVCHCPNWLCSGF